MITFSHNHFNFRSLSKDLGTRLPQIFSVGTGNENVPKLKLPILKTSTHAKSLKPKRPHGLERCHFFPARHCTFTLIFLPCWFKNWHRTEHRCRTLIFSTARQCLHLRKSWHGTANRGTETDVFGSARHC